MTQLFISYSRKDIDFVRQLAGDLEKAGYQVWWDLTDLRGGDDWVRLIPEAIANSDFFIVVLSPNSTTSEWVRREYTQALSLRKKVIPIMLERTAVPFSLNTINFLDFTSEAAYPQNVKALLLALGYTGDMPAVMPLSRPLTVRSLIVPISVSVLIVLVIAAFFVFNPSASPTPSPTEPASTGTATITPPFTTTAVSDTPTMMTATRSPTLSPTTTVTPTGTATATPTATATHRQEPVPYCVRRNLDVREAINVRKGPGITYPAFENGLPLGKCVYFRAVSEDGMWLLVAAAADQSDPDVAKFEGGWIQRDLLLIEGTLNLPAVTLTPTPIPSSTPTITLTPTRTPTPSETPAPLPTDTPTPTETETPVP